MGTRSTIKFQEDGETVCTIYQQYDGYPDYVGKKLAEFLKEITMVNGIPLGDTGKRFANGVGCLAAQFVAQFKKCAGGLYIVSDDCDEEYNYVVNYEHDENMRQFKDFVISVNDSFRGNLEEFEKFCKDNS